MQVTRLHFLCNGAGGAFGVYLGGVAQVLHIQRRVLARQLTYRLRNAAQVLEGVVAGQHAVGVRRAGQQGRIDLRQVACIGVLQRLAADRAVQPLPLPIGMTHAVHVQLRHFCITTTLVRGFPGVGRLRGLAQSGAVTALLVGKHPCGGPALCLCRAGALRGKVFGQLLYIARDQVEVVGFLELRHLAHAFIHPAHHQRKLVAVRTRDADQHIQPRPVEFGQRQGVQPGHAAGIVPARFHTQCIQGLRFRHALVPHGFTGPQGKGDLLRPAPAVFLAVLFHPCIKGGHTRVPGLPGWHAAGVKTIEVAARRQALGIAHRVAAITGLDMPAVQRCQEAADLFVVGQRSIQLLGTLGQREQDLCIQHLGGGAVRYGDMRSRLDGICSVLRAQVKRARGLGVLERHLQPARRTRITDFFEIEQEHLVDVLPQRINQRLAQGLHHRAKTALRIRHFAKSGQTQRLGGLCNFIKIGVQHFHETGEVSADFFLRPADVAVKLVLDKGGNQARFKLLLHRARRNRFPVMHQVVHLMHTRPEAGRRKHRRGVAHQHGPAAPLGRQGLAKVVHDVGVDIRQIAECQQRVILCREAALLARRPLQRAVRAHMHDHAGMQLRAQPQVGGQVVVAQGNGSAMAYAAFPQRCRRARGDLVAQRLRHDDHVAQQHTRDDETRFRLA
ncbi:hypothetical protein D9M73_83120 [compost metagenome]